ncbi:MAG: hypothetical protein ABEJ94_06260 [Halorientalis sp.]
MILGLGAVGTASVGAVPADGNSNATGDGPAVATSVERVGEGGTLRYELTLTGLAEYDRVGIVVGRAATVVASEGLTATEREGRTWLRAADGRETATVRIRTTVSAARPGRGGEFFPADTWLLGRVPLVELRWTNGAGIDRRRLLDDVGSGSGRVTAGDRYVLVGDQRTRTVATAGGEIRIAWPAGTALGPDADALAAALSDAAGRLDVGDRGDAVLLFALGDPARRGGESFPGFDEAWVDADSPLDDPNSVWLHEYVHTRQEFVLAPGMRWFREASAEYYAARLAYEQGRIDRVAMSGHLDGEPVTATLTEPRSWDDPYVPYTKGARVLALLDRKIRLSTDGERSLEDVFRRLNAHEGPVTYDDFTDAVAAVAGHRMDGWLDRYVAGDEPVASFYPGVPERSGLFAGSWSFIADAGPGGVFLVLSVLLSAVGSVPLYRYLDRLDDGDGDGDADDRDGRSSWPA